MDERLLATVNRRLDESDLDDEAGLLVLAACESDEALAEAIGGRAPDLPTPGAPDATDQEPVGAYLASIAAEGFRGVGEARTLELTPGPGLTLVIGRNGSGKSSFVEALEVLLTGGSRRWTTRKEKAWREGWRNLHHPDPASVRATIAVDGAPGVTTLAREWGPADDVDGASTTAQAHGKSKGSITALGWGDALVANRPILSYNELGSILDEGPSHLHDALAGILGLDDVAAAVERLRTNRLDLDKSTKSARTEAQTLTRALEEIDDERATQCMAAMAGAHPNLDAIAAVVTGTPDQPDATSDLDLLRAFSQLTGPDPDTVATAVERARQAADARDAVVGTDAEAADRTSRLLRQALEHHDHSGAGPCPVCGVGTLDQAWAEQTASEVERLDRVAREARHALEEEREARRRLESLKVLPSVSLPEAARLKLDADAARQSWERWLDVDADDLRGAAAAFEALLPDFTAAVATLRASAQEAYAQREDVWQPVAEQVAAWLERARAAERANKAQPMVKAAEDWLGDITDELRDERLSPIAAQAADVWKHLSQHSNVQLGPITLKGKGTSRKVELKVSVDGIDSAALSVMSQGELHALALAIFLPRATRPESPFRFLVIDDPVQAMDPAKVDGLARVLETTAKDRQVVVFTHDDRLPEAARRLGIDAQVLQVTRRDGSLVDIRAVADPASLYIEDAFAITLTEDLPDDAKRRVVPGYCRHALEAVCNDVIRRKLLGAGTPHGEVEDRIAKVTTLTTRAALALFGNEERGGEVMTQLNKFGGWAGDAFKASNKGSHDSYAGDLKGLVRDTEKLVAKIRATA